MKKTKRFAEAHTSRTQTGSGDYYGTGVRNKVGTVQRDYISGVVSKSKMKKPPKSLA